MIQEEDIREFQEIIVGSRLEDGESGHIEGFDEDNEDNFYNEDTPDRSDEAGKSAVSTPNTLILFVTGMFGIVFVISVFVWAITYVYMNQNKNTKNIEGPQKTAQSLKIPGIEDLVTDPIPDDSGKVIKVWCLRTTVPPPVKLGFYSEDFDDL